MLTVLATLLSLNATLFCSGPRAKAEGARFGRKPKLTKHQAREALKRVAGNEPLCEVALSYNVDHSTISRLRVRHAAEA